MCDPTCDTCAFFVAVIKYIRKHHPELPKILQPQEAFRVNPSTMMSMLPNSTALGASLSLTHSAPNLSGQGPFNSSEHIRIPGQGSPRRGTLVHALGEAHPVSEG